MTDIKAVDIDRIRTFVAVRQAARPARRTTFALALPLVAFLVVAFVTPILYMPSPTPKVVRSGFS